MLSWPRTPFLMADRMAARSIGPRSGVTRHQSSAMHAAIRSTSLEIIAALKSSSMARKRSIGLSAMLGSRHAMALAAPSRAIGSDRPEVTLGIAHRVLTRTVVGVGERHHDFGTGGHGSGVVGIDVVHGDVDAAPFRRPGIGGIGPAASRQHQHAAAKGEFGVPDTAVGRRGLEVALEAEGAYEPIDGGSAIPIAQDRVDV